MIKCHKCKLETKQLNGLMSRHYRIHCDDFYTKEQYKRELLILNGRPPNNCKICNAETKIPKGEAAYPNYCKSCYIKKLSTNVGVVNVNWKGGKKLVECAHCSKQLEKHESHLKRTNKFCSISCSQSFYGLQENRTKIQKENDIVQGDRLRRMTREPYLREKLAKARAKLGSTRISKKEMSCLQIIKGLYPSTIQSHLIKYYTFDGFIPEFNLLIEFDGTYWHALPKTIDLDKRKTTYINRWHSHLKILRIKEVDWDKAPNKDAFIRSLFTKLSE